MKRMIMRKLCRLAIILAAIFSLSPSIAIAHDPALHGFRVVTFKRSIAAPEFILKNLSGEIVKLEQFRGDYILLNFWATWCPPCVKEMPSMERLQQKFKDKGIRVVAISLDKEPQAKVAAFVARLNLSFPILLDPDGIVSDPYGANALPSTFILNPDGRVIAAAKGERDWYGEEAISYFDELLEQ
jgi:peroxiredoxin